jgi:hypothetical protein
MTQRHVVQIPVDTQTGIILEPTVSSVYEYVTALEKGDRDIIIKSRIWIKKVFNTVTVMIALFVRLLRWLNGFGSNKIDSFRMEQRNDRQLGIRKWNL